MTKIQSESLAPEWRDRWAQAWATTVVRVLGTPFPWQSQHMSSGPDDCDVTPWKLHPSFHGSLDWHSSAHMQWSGLTLLDTASDAVRPDTLAALREQLQARLQPEALAVEATYLRNNPAFERPYGWGWATLLTATATHSRTAANYNWAQSLAPLVDVIALNLLSWMPKLVYPVRHGVHDNTAFALSMARDGFQLLNREDVVDAIDAHALRWFGSDRDFPSSWEPSGNDFLSGALSEADLMRRVLDPERFSSWLALFLPQLGKSGDPLLLTPRVADPTDGKLVHLYGLALSRAGQLRNLAPFLSAERRSTVLEAARTQLEEVSEQIVSGHFMTVHWLVSFALLAVLDSSDQSAAAGPQHD